MGNKTASIRNRIFLGFAAAASIALAGCPNNIFYGLEPKPNDTDGPEITVINPQENQRVSGVMIVIGTATDKYQVQSVQYTIDNGALADMEGTYTWSRAVDTNELSQGPHTVTIVGTDSFNNSTTIARNIIVDQSVPNVNVTLDYDLYQNYVRGANVALSGTTADNNSVSGVQISFNGGVSYVDAVLDADKTGWSYTIADTALVIPGDGLVTPLLRAIDDSGLIGINSFPLYIDNTAPTVTVTIPAADTTIDASADLTGDLLVVSGASSDPPIMSVVHLRDVTVTVGTLPAAVSTSLSTTYSVSVNISSIKSNGPVAVNVALRDKAGNTATRLINIALDDTPPYFTGAVSTVEKGALDGDLAKTNNNLGSGTFLLQGTVADPDAPLDTQIASMTLSLSGGPTAITNLPVNNNTLGNPLDDGKVTVGGAWSHLLDTAAIGDGTYTLTLRVTDTVGGFEAITRAIVIDKTAASASIVNPADMALVSGTAIAISGTAGGTGSGVSTIRIYVDDSGSGLPYETDNTFTAPSFAGLSYNAGNFTYLWDSTAFTNNTHVIGIVVTDLAGNPGSTTRSVVKDPSAPVIAFTEYDHPANTAYTARPLTNGRYINGAGTIKGTATDDVSVQTVQLSIDGGGYTDLGVAPGASVPWQYTLPGLGAGSHTITARVTDNVPSQNTTFITVIVDNDAPSIDGFSASLTDGSGTSYYHGVVSVSGISSDAAAGVESAAVTVDETPAGGEAPESLAVSGTTSFSAGWDTEGLPTLAAAPVIAQDGIAVAAVVTDAAGNVTGQSLSADVRPYVSMMSKYRAWLGEAGQIVSGDNFSNTSSVTVGGGNVTVTARNPAATPNTITFTVPGAYPPADGLSSGPVIVTTGGVTNAAQTAVKMDIYHRNTIEAAAGLYPSAQYLGSALNLSYGTNVSGDRYLHYYYRATSTDAGTLRTIVWQVGNPSYSHMSVSATSTYQYVTYYASGGGESDIRIARSQNYYAASDFTGKNISDNGGGMYSCVRANPANPLNVHVVYFESSGGTGSELRYMYSTDGFATVPAPVTLDGTATDAGRWCSMALDSGGNPHVVYYDATNTSVKYIYYTGSSWSTPVTVAAGNVGNFGNSIAIGTDGSIHISFYDGNSGDLKYAYSAGSGYSFTTTIVDEYVIAGMFSSIVLDASNHPHIGYAEFTGPWMKYARYTGTAWVTAYVAEDVIYNLNSNSNYTSIGIDENGRVHVYFSVTGNLREAVYFPED